MACSSGFASDHALAGQLAAAQAEGRRGRQGARQNREGDSAGMTDAASNPDALVPVVVSLPESSTMSDDGLAMAYGAAARKQAQGNHPGSELSFISGGAIKRITAGVKARRDRPRQVRSAGGAFILPTKSISNEKRSFVVMLALVRGGPKPGLLRPKAEARFAIQADLVIGA
jgi:hypothetical protein